MKKWGIIGALDAEVASIRAAMEVADTRTVCGCEYISGTLHGVNIVLVCSGVGMINAAVCTTVMIREFGADVLINAGIAGSLCKELHVLDVVIADDLVNHTADVDILKKYYPHQRSYPTDPGLRDLAVRALEALPELSVCYRVGRIASGDRYVTDSVLKQQIADSCDPLCVEMEGAAIAQVAYMNQVPCLVIRTLSDNADEDADQSYDNFFEKAAGHSSAILIKMLELSLNS